MLKLRSLKELYYVYDVKESIFNIVNFLLSTLIYPFAYIFCKIYNYDNKRNS